MNNKDSIIKSGKKTIEIELNAIQNLKNKIDKNFVDAISLILKSKGKVIVSGIGKSGIIAKKIVATMNSTGTNAVYLHPSDAIHGDLGIVKKNDVIIFLSKSGDTKEILQLLPSLKNIGIKIISLVGNLNSILAKNSAIVLNCKVEMEACPFNLAPTSSTTAMLVMGDAIAVTLLEQKKFSKNDFARSHPGGNLGKKLLLKVNEIMVKEKFLPIVKENIFLQNAIVEISSKRFGATCVVNKNGTLVGIITDGDLRRILEKHKNIDNLNAKNVMTKNPKTVFENALVETVLHEMENFNITQMIVIDKNNKPIGMIHIHDLIKSGFGE